MSTGGGSIRQQLANLDLRIIIDSSLIEWKELEEEEPTGNEWEDRKLARALLLDEEMRAVGAVRRRAVRVWMREAAICGQCSPSCMRGADISTSWPVQHRLTTTTVSKESYDGATVSRLRYASRTDRSRYSWTDESDEIGELGRQGPAADECTHNHVLSTRVAEHISRCGWCIGGVLMCWGPLGADEQLRHIEGFLAK
ncbi:hypothetical protein Tco_1042528 [Tanacetum coccineum]|uniref:Uncharacterized protein n=1 Tax=Tanacetum coccineum TaxID=301880 RepID=A0ABQ5GLZ9_9ASTR